MSPINPCGMGMDVVRSCKTVWMRLHRNSEKKTRVNWFFVGPCAEIFPHTHRFASGDWKLHEPVWPGTGEVREGRKWRNGSRPEGFEGCGFSGPLEYFQNGAPPAAPSLPFNVGGYAAECPDCGCSEVWPDVCVAACVDAAFKYDPQFPGLPCAAGCVDAAFKYDPQFPGLPCAVACIDGIWPPSPAPPGNECGTGCQDGTFDGGPPLPGEACGTGCQDGTFDGGPPLPGEACGTGCQDGAFDGGPPLESDACARGCGGTAWGEFGFDP